MVDLIKFIIVIIVSIIVVIIILKLNSLYKNLLNNNIKKKFIKNAKRLLDITSEEEEEVNNGYVFDRSTTLLTITSIISGSLLLVFGKDFVHIIKNIEPFNTVQVIGLVILLTGFLFYSVQLSRIMLIKGDIPAFIFWMLSYMALVFEISLILGTTLDALPNVKSASFLIGLVTFLNICIIFIVIVHLLEILILKINNLFKNPTERLSVILGFFGTLIILITKIIK